MGLLTMIRHVDYERFEDIVALYKRGEVHEAAELAAELRIELEADSKGEWFVSYSALRALRDFMEGDAAPIGALLDWAYRWGQTCNQGGLDYLREDSIAERWVLTKGSARFAEIERVIDRSFAATSHEQDLYGPAF